MNNEKNYAVFSASINNGEELLGIFRLLVKSLPIQHLGVPITRKTIKHQDYNNLLDALQVTLNRLKDKCLTRARRIWLV